MGRPAEVIRIGEFARRTSLSVHQLRYYHEVGLLQPGYVDAESGYRYYDAPQVEVAELIALLRSLDIPLADIRRLLQQPSRAREILAAQRVRLAARFEEAERQLARFEELITGGNLMIRVERPQDLVPMRVTGVRVHPATQQHVVVLETEDGATSLPIWIGSAKATGIAVHLEGQPTERPLTHDLMASLCGAAELRVESVAIWRSPESPMVFLAAVAVDADGRHQLIDARPSDAINLALRTGAGIAVGAETLAAVGVSAAEVTATPPRPGRTVEVVTEDGESLGSAALYVDPAVGNQAQLFRAFEVTGVEAPDTVRVRELAELKRIAVFPRAPERPRH